MNCKLVVSIATVGIGLVRGGGYTQASLSSQNLTTSQPLVIVQGTRVSHHCCHQRFRSGSGMSGGPMNPGMPRGNGGTSGGGR